MLSKDQIEERLRHKKPYTKKKIINRYKRFATLDSIAKNTTTIKGSTLSGLFMASVAGVYTLLTHVVGKEISPEESVAIVSIAGAGLSTYIIGNITGRIDNYLDRKKYNNLILEYK